MGKLLDINIKKTDWIIFTLFVVFIIFSIAWKYDKNLWDLLDLIIVPVVLGIGASLLNKSQSENAQLIASNQQEEALLQNYIDAMTILVLEKNLRQAKSTKVKDKDLRNIARSRTLTVLRALDTPNRDGNNRRRASLLRFLYENELINGENPIISLKNANLETAYARRIDLRKANLEGVTFYNADLRDADLRGANLKDAYLVNAKLQGADLTGANLNNTNLKGARYGEYVDTITIWPKGFNIVGKELIQDNIKNSGDYSKMYKLKNK